MYYIKVITISEGYPVHEYSKATYSIKKDGWVEVATADGAVHSFNREYIIKLEIKNAS